VALGALGGAGVADERHQIAEIAGVAHRALDALVGHHSRHDQRAHAEIPQYVIDVGRNKNAARRLAKDHLVAYRGDLVEHPRIPRSLRYVDTRDLVVEAAVTAVPGHVLDGRVDDLDMCATAGGLQKLQIGQHGFAQAVEEIVALLRVELVRAGAVGMCAVILDIDDQQSRMGRIDRNVAAHCDHRRKNSLYAAGNRRARRSAQTVWPAGSVIWS